jgi:hypothetical protein
MSLLALVFALTLQATSSDDTFAYGNVLLRVPEGWQVETRDEGLFLRPPDLKKNESYVVIIPPGTKADVNLAAGFEKIWKQVAGTRKIAKKAPEREIKTEGGVDGLMSVGLMDDADDARLIATVALFKPADRFQAVLALTAEDHVFQRYSEAFGLLIKGLRFRNTELPATRPPDVDGLQREGREDDRRRALPGRDVPHDASRRRARPAGARGGKEAPYGIRRHPRDEGRRRDDQGRVADGDAEAGARRIVPLGRDRPVPEDSGVERAPARGKVRRARRNGGRRVPADGTMDDEQGSRRPTGPQQHALTSPRRTRA